MATAKYYITTPIYYPSDRLHIGHAYTTVFCDSVARWRRMAGEEVFFLTGSDDHGQKVQRAAQSKGMSPKEYVDQIVPTFKELWKRLDVSYDDFIRTTEPRHVKVVQEIFQHLYEKGDIYKGTYDGWYCTPCETFWLESKLGEEKLCPDCGRPVEWVEEESYFFRMSKYADQLLAYIEANPDFIQPESRRNEVVSFIQGGLEDLSVSRTTFDWGVPVPFDPKHVTYVWIDALSNYVTAAGYLQDDAAFNKWWPADVHVVGKDILRFHAIIWPAILLAAGLPLPKQVYAHGWLLSDTGKMSKSKGNVVDPNRLIDFFGADAIRYFLLREVSFGQDARYSTEAMVERINSDLANDLGNSFHRSIAMLRKFCGGVIPAPQQTQAMDEALRNLAENTLTAVDQAVRSLHVNAALAELWKLVRAVNKYIDDSKPWALAKESDPSRLHTVMYYVFEALRIVSLLVTPFMPRTGQACWEQLGQSGRVEEQGLAAAAWGGTRPGTAVKGGDPLFPRLDVEKVLEELLGSSPQPAGHSTTGESAGGQARSSAPVQDAKDAHAQQLEAPASRSGSEAERSSGEVAKSVDGLITIDDFGKVQLRLAKVLAAEKVKGADKLLKLQVDLGAEKRQIVAGIAQHYAPEELVGRTIVVVANLQPAKLRGEISQGMLLAASDETGRVSLLTVDRELGPGSVVR